jgi:hypothetical protein
MDKSIGIMVVLGVVGLLGLLAIYRFFTQRRQLSSGRSIGRFFPDRRDGKFVFENPINVTTGGQWCRLLLTLKSVEEDQINKSPRHFFEKVALLVGTPYKLSLKDGKNRVVHTETGSLGPFISWLGSRQHTTETLFRERSQGSHEGTVTLLEFLPQEAGSYWLSLQITEKVAAEYLGSSSTWEVLKVELSVREGVIPLSETVSYPHRRVHI